MNVEERLRKRFQRSGSKRFIIVRRRRLWCSGLLLAQDLKIRRGEVAFLKRDAGEAAAELALKWQQELGESHSARKIALIDLSVPTLRNLSRPEYERFVGITQKLIGSDGRVDIFEYMLQRLIEHHLDGHFGHRGVRSDSIPQVGRFGRGDDVADFSLCALESGCGGGF